MAGLASQRMPPHPAQLTPGTTYAQYGNRPRADARARPAADKSDGRAAAAAAAAATVTSAAAAAAERVRKRLCIYTYNRQRRRDNDETRELGCTYAEAFHIPIAMSAQKQSNEGSRTLEGRHLRATAMTRPSISSLTARVFSPVRPHEGVYPNERDQTGNRGVRRKSTSVIGKHSPTVIRQ